jgi:phosphatidate cytidylyltransferase
MALHWPTFLQRTGSAIVFAIIMMAGLLWNQWSFLALALIIQFLCLKEFFFLAEKISGLVFPSWMKWGIIVFLNAVILFYTLYSVMYENGVSNRFVSLADLLPLFLCLPISFLLIFSLNKNNYTLQIIWSLSGILYISLPTFMLLYIYDIQWSLPLAIVLMIWSNDTMAYIVGSFIGKTPFSSISPKKTWEGTIGGALLTIAGAFVWSHFSTFKMMDAVVLALCATIAGTIGDLFESRLKRMADVKDSGNIMPGHGGALDRFDSLLVAVPFAFVYLYAVKGLLA